MNNKLVWLLKKNIVWLYTSVECNHVNISKSI